MQIRYILFLLIFLAPSLIDGFYYSRYLIIARDANIESKVFSHISQFRDSPIRCRMLVTKGVEVGQTFLETYCDDFSSVFDFDEIINKLRTYFEKISEERLRTSGVFKSEFSFYKFIGPSDITGKFDNERIETVHYGKIVRNSPLRYLHYLLNSVIMSLVTIGVLRRTIE